MKQRDLIKKLEDNGFVFERHGGNHDIYRRGNDIEKVPVKMIGVVSNITRSFK